MGMSRSNDLLAQWTHRERVRKHRVENRLTRRQIKITTQRHGANWGIHEAQKNSAIWNKANQNFSMHDLSQLYSSKSEVTNTNYVNRTRVRYTHITMHLNTRTHASEQTSACIWTTSFTGVFTWFFSLYVTYLLQLPVTQTWLLLCT